ncbi:MAG: phenylalanine--tRNA ligase subunit beta [Nanoarchaeota archaeon]|nr:phenylalanine--tRNA ligase subunit beta [Nanoarchaeota archaeon]MBU1052141.1 phenylalanine--tRNA ligase subunit beta [Nanoarchaeota archaeon]
MTTCTFPRKEFEAQLGKKITKEIEEKISLFGTPLESLSSDSLEIEVFPNRPDLISFQGYIRGFKAFLEISPGLKKYSLKKPEKNYNVKVSPSVKDIRPYTICAIVKDLKFDDEKIKEIIDLQEKLHITLGRNRKKVAIGIYPLEKISLPIRYIALEPEKIKFIPLESDKEMTGNQILSKHPTGRDYAHLLEDYDKYPIFIDSKNKILSMPPIINSRDTGKITHETKEVFIECSGFSLEVLQKTLNIIVTTLADIGGTIYQMTLDYGNKKITTPNLTPEKMKLSLANTNKLLGLDLKESDLQKLLPKMGYEYKNKTVSIPAWRTDILHEVDIIEDIAIAYGYDNFTPEVPNISTTGEESQESKIKSKLAEILIGLGLIEISTYHLIKQNEAELFKLSDEKKIELEDSKTEYKILRPNLLIPSLRILSENKDHEYPQNTFEIGTVFSLNEKQETGIKETENLIILCSPGNFTKMKQVLNYLTQQLGINYTLEESSHSQLIEGRTAQIKINNKEVGYLGELHPETLRAWGLKMPVAVLEIELEEVFELLKK